MRTVLIVDDNPAVGEALSLLLSLHDIRPLIAMTPQEGLATLDRELVDVVIQDMNFTADTTSGEEGVALFRAIRQRHADLPLILLTAWTHLETAVELVKAGAADYVAKPWDDTKLLATVENLLELSARLSDDGEHPVVHIQSAQRDILIHHADGYTTAVSRATRFNEDFQQAAAGATSGAEQPAEAAADEQGRGAE